MATVTLQIPDVKGLNISAIKEELDKYVQSLVVILSDRENLANDKKAKLKSLRSLYSTFSTPSSKSYEELRAEAMHERYGV